MRSTYKKLGTYIRELKVKNSDGACSDLRGVSIGKEFMPSVANVHGTDLSKYKRVKKHQFAFNPMHVGRDEVLPIALLADDGPIIVSPAYVVFEVRDQEELLPEYLMMWCRRPEFDRNAWFTTDSSVRGGFSWDNFCDMELPIPSIEKQREIVKEYQAIVNRIRLNEQLNKKLEEAAQAIYKQWFVDFEFPMSAEYAESIGKSELAGQPYKSSGGEMEYNDVLEQEIPKGWSIKPLSGVCEVINGRAYKEGEYRKDGTKIIRIQNLNGGENWLYSDMELPEKKYVSEGALIFAWSATFGPFIWRGPKSIYHYHIWRLDCFDLRAKFFLFHHLKRITSEVSGQGSGSIFAHITKTLMEEQLVVYPDDHTISLFSQLAGVLDKMTAVCFKDIELSKQLKSVILSKMAGSTLQVENAA